METTIASRLGFARAASGLSKRRLAELAGLDPSHVRLIEGGLRPDPSGTTMAALATVLGVDAIWLITGAGSEPVVETIQAAVHRTQHPETEPVTVDRSADFNQAPGVR